jgi:prephenate dehydrogenase
MSDVTIAIVGTGVVGTSLGLALKQLEPAPHLIGHDKDLRNAKAAAKMGAFDQVEWNLLNAIDQADLVVLAIPLAGVAGTLEAIGPELKEDAVVTDTSRLKGPVLEHVRQHLPPHAHFVGGNPLVSPGGSGYTHARADLFEGVLYCLTPEAETHQDAVALVEDMVRRIGAKPFYLDAVEHDGLVCGVDQLPLVLSMVMMQAASSSDVWREARKLAGPAFLQATASVDGDPDELRDRILLDRDNILRWIDAYEAELTAFRGLIAAEDSEALTEMAARLEARRSDWLRDYQNKDFIDPGLRPKSMDQPSLMRRLIGFGR